MRKKYLLFASIVSVCLITLLLVSAFVGAGSVEGVNDSGGDGSFVISSVEQIEQVSHYHPGDVAVFDVSLTGNGVLQVWTSDYNPTSYPDWWRVTIFIYKEGPGAWAVSDEAQTQCNAPGTGTGWGPWVSRADMLCNGDYNYLVFVSYEKGSDTWSAGIRIRFLYTGTGMTVTGPREGYGA